MPLTHPVSILSSRDGKAAVQLSHERQDGTSAVDHPCVVLPDEVNARTQRIGASRISLISNFKVHELVLLSRELSAMPVLGCERRPIWSRTEGDRIMHCDFGWELSCADVVLGGQRRARKESRWE